MEVRYKEISAQLASASHNSDESEKGRKTLETQGIDDDEMIGNLEKAFIEAQTIADEADKRYDEVDIISIFIFWNQIDLIYNYLYLLVCSSLCYYGSRVRKNWR